LDGTVQWLNTDVDWFDSVPAWTIMAFNLTKCPTWWDPYPIANWRFLMWGKTSSSDETWWDEDNKITLNVWQIPEHSHVFADTIFSEKWDQSAYASNNTYLKDYIVVEKYKLNSDDSYMVWHHGTSIDTDNYLWAWLRKTSASICTDDGVTIDGLTSTSIGWGDVKPLQRLSKAENNCKSGNPSVVNIANAYVKVLYCIKQWWNQWWNTTHTLQPVINVKNNSSTYIDTFTLVINWTTFRKNHRLAAWSKGSVSFSSSDNPSIEPGTYSTIKVFGDWKECNLENGWNKNLVDEAWWAWWHDSYGNGYLWICS
jgi:hypothetical protein